MHEVQAATLRTLREDDGLPVRLESVEAATRVLDRTLTEIAKRYDEEIAPAIPRVWQDEIAAVRADLRLWMRRLAADADRWVPAHFELTFGLPSEGRAEPGSVPEPVELPGGWRLRGAVDLVERSADGSTLRVTDHKTGGDHTSPGFVVGGGETLQPVLYSLVVEDVLKGSVTEARLSFCTSRGELHATAPWSIDELVAAFTASWRSTPSRRALSAGHARHRRRGRRSTGAAPARVRTATSVAVCGPARREAHPRGRMRGISGGAEEPAGAAMTAPPKAIRTPGASPSSIAADREAIRSDLDSTLVVEAAAGTGQDHGAGRPDRRGAGVAVLRVAEIVAAVTFTDKAAGEMKLRLRAGAGEGAPGSVTAGLRRAREPGRVRWRTAGRGARRNHPRILRGPAS